MYQFKANETTLCFGNISKILQLMTWRKKGVSKLSFFVDYNAIDTSDILDIKWFLMNER